jgi:hypothetical protein
MFDGFYFGVKLQEFLVGNKEIREYGEESIDY